MPMRHPLLSLAIAGTLVAGALTTQAQEIAIQDLMEIAHAAETCQPAREYPDLRVRQLEMDNIGKANAYIVCGLTRPSHASSTTQAVAISFVNDSPEPATITCNLQDNRRDVPLEATITYRKQLVLQPGASGMIGFGESFDETTYQYSLALASAQCILPPGTSAVSTWVEHELWVMLPAA